MARETALPPFVPPATVAQSPHHAKRALPKESPLSPLGGTFCRLRAGARVLLGLVLLGGAGREHRGAAGAGLEALVGDRLIARARIRRLPVGGGAASAFVGAAVEARARGERLGRGDLDAASALVRAA